MSGMTWKNQIPMKKTKWILLGTTIKAIETAQTFVPVRRFAATAAVVGVTVAAVSYVAPQGFSAVVSGVGGAVVTAVVQTYGWLRKSARSVGLLA